jgi:transcriptional regulator with XRE-family HTH domain
VSTSSGQGYPIGGENVDIYHFIGERVKQLREDARMSQEALGKELKVSTNTISRWETATYKPGIAELQRIAEYFKVRLVSLFPPEETQDITQKALLSATGDLPEEDIKELIAYAEFRRARRLLEKGKQQHSA